MSKPHEVAVPALHVRLSDQRRETEKWHRLAKRLAEALDAEVDLRLEARHDDKWVRSMTAYSLGLARKERLL